jgi:hypothetical protein
LADDFDFDFTDDAPARPAVPRATRVVFVLPQDGQPGELFVKGDNGRRLDLVGEEGQAHLSAIGQTYVAIRSIFPAALLGKLDRVADARVH